MDADDLIILVRMISISMFSIYLIWKVFTVFFLT